MSTAAGPGFLRFREPYLQPSNGESRCSDEGGPNTPSEKVHGVILRCSVRNGPDTLAGNFCEPILARLGFQVFSSILL
jgi:hypothetical protein